jgi:hypothetical protein
MKKGILIIIIAVGLTDALHASPDGVKKDSTRSKPMLGYFFNVGVGGMIGCSNCSMTGKLVNFTLTTVHGIRIGDRLSVGAGVGFDQYENWKTMPLYGSASWDLFGRKNKVFVQMNYGYASGWINKAVEGYGYKKSSGGQFIYPAIGYSVHQGKLRINFTAGYKRQTVEADYNTFYPLYQPWSSQVPAPTSDSETINTTLRRAVFTMSIGIN